MKEKIMNFAMENWEGIGVLTIIAIGEIAVCTIYKNWLYKQ